MIFRKKNIFIILFLFSSSLFAQETLSNLNTSWSNVLSGVVICEPAVTSYGFCAVTDARTISAFTNSGKLLWEKNTGRLRNIILHPLPDDFILYIDLSNKILKILNPTGTEIWSKNLNYMVNKSPLAGRDGRFFLSGENIVECYGINGVQKWQLETETQKNIPIQELPDGSIVIFLADEKNQTKGLRISPFGLVLEEILFSGSVTTANTCEDGILLTFTDGSAGLFSIQDGFSQNKWVLSKRNTNALFSVSENKSDYLYIELLSDGIVLNELNQNDGSVTHSIKIKEILGTKVEKICFNESGILLIDNKSAGLYSKNGKEIWFAKLPSRTSKTTWNHIIYTSDNHLIFCYKNWTLNAYRIAQNNSHSVNNSVHEDYDSFMKYEKNFDTQYSYSFSQEIISESRIDDLNSGLYADKEKIYLQDIISICSAYSEFLSTSDFGTRKEKSIFEQDSAGFEKVLAQLMLLGNKNSQNLAASILAKTNNRSFQRVILSGIKSNGYDPDERLLKSIEKVSQNISYKDKVFSSFICDAVYSICLFMGRPAYNSKGKDILKNFMYPSYDAKIREYARDTLKRIIELDL